MESYTISAPARVDLAGGTLDLWPLHSFLGECRTINLAIGLYQKVTLSLLPGREFHFEVVSAGSSGNFSSPLSLVECQALAPELKFPVWVVSQYLEQFSFSQSIRIEVTSDIPLRSGLGGSSVLAVALVRALARLQNRFVDLGWQWELLDWVKDVEAAFLRVPTGTQDYLAGLFGGLSCFVNGRGLRERESYPDEVYEALDAHLLVLFSGEMHSSGLSNWEIYKAAVEGDKKTLAGLEQIRQIAASLHAELTSGVLSWKTIGKLVSEEWEVRKATFQVNTPRLEQILTLLRSQKVIGAKVCGAAQGGSFLVLVEPDRRESLISLCQSQNITVLPARATRRGVGEALAASTR